MPQVEIEGIPETLDFPDDTPQEVISGTVKSLLQSRTKTETAAVAPPQQTAMEHAKATIASLTPAPGTSAVEKLGQFAQKPIFTVAPWVKPLIEKSPGMALVRATFGDESAKGIEDFMLGQGKFFATPAGILTLGVGGLSATIQKVVAGAFVGQMAASLPQDYKALQEAADAGDVRKATEIIATGATKLGLIGAVGAKAFSKEAAIDEKIAPVAPATATALKDTISVAEKEGPSATTERTQPTGDLVEHQPVSEGGIPPETGGGDRLQQGGEVPKTEEVTTPEPAPEAVGAATPEDVGRKAEIEQLTDAFKGAEGNKVPLTEQVKQAFDVGEKLSKAKDAVGNALEALKFTGEFLVKKLDAVSDWDSIKKIKGELSAEIESGGWRLRKFEKAVKRAFSDPKERAAISNWIEHDGDAASLTKAMNETAPEFRKSYQDALNLSDDAKVAARNVKNYFESVLQEAIDAGVIDHGIEDYLHRVYQKDTPGRQQLLARVQSGILNTRKPGLAMKRLFEMDIDAEKAGLKPVKDFLPRILDYETSLRRAIASRAAVKKFTEVIMPDGRPMLSVKGIGIPVEDPAGVREATLIRPKLAQHDPNKPGYNGDYVDRNYPALRKWKWVSQDADGKPIFLQGDVSIHPDAVKRMDALLEPSRSGKGVRTLLGVSTTVKQTMLDLSGFHQVQIAIHAAEHQVMPWKVIQDIDLDNPQVQGLLKGGVTLGGEYRTGELAEGLVGRSLTRQIPGLGPLMETYHAWLFQDFIPRVKMSMALHALERNRVRFANDLKSGKMTEEQLNFMTAKQANAAFGEQNYTVMERSKTARDISRALLMAPDFLEARGRFVGQALQKGGDTKLGFLTANEQRQALLLGAVTMYITARIANKALSGQYRMEPENAFSLVYNGKRYSLRTIQGDILHLIDKPAQFWLSRLNPITTRPVLEAVTGRDYFGRKRSAIEQAWDFASTVIPISMRTSSERHLWESMAAGFGLNVRRFSEVDAAYKLAQKWKQEHGVVERGEFIYDPDKDALRPLKIALSESDDAAAVKAIRNLIDSKQYTQKKLFDYFKTYANRPFTGSKANDTKWVSGLSEEDKKTVEVARQYRRRMFELYQNAQSIYESKPAKP